MKHIRCIVAVLLTVLALCSCAMAEFDLTNLSEDELHAMSDHLNRSHGTSMAISEKLPAVYFTGDTLLMTKHNALSLKLDFYDGETEFHGYAKVKWQGTTSIAYPKKNFNISLYEDEALTTAATIDFGWGAQQKYCLKANYVDHTHARNVVSARLWGDVVRSRDGFENLPVEMKNAPNHGAIDGFPIKLYINGEYEGLYTWNIPKDAWAFGMDPALDNHTVLCGENYASACFRAPAVIDGSDWSDEVHDVVPESILVRWNEVIDFVQNSSDEEFVAGIDQYIDKESLIDYYLFAYLSCGLDSMGKNQLYCTYDGQKWYASMYDMDATWGLHYSGELFVTPEYRCQKDYESNAGDHPGNLLYERVEKLLVPEIQARYAQLREGALSNVNILQKFSDFCADIPIHLYAEDLALHPDIPSAEGGDIHQITDFLKDRAAYVDFMIANLGHRATYMQATKPTEPYSVNGTDELGNYAFRLNEPMRRASFTLDTGFKPFDVEKDWTIYCKFADSMVPEDGRCAAIFEMRDYFPEEQAQTAVSLRRIESDEGQIYSFAGGFGGFNFPFDRADDYEEPTDGYHRVVIIKEGRNYRFYLNGGLAYNCPLDYGVAEACMSENTLFLFGRDEDGVAMNRAFGEIADFRIYNEALPVETFANIDAFDWNGVDAFGSYAVKTLGAITSDGDTINTAFKPYDVEKNWTLFCKFSGETIAKNVDSTGSIFEMREYFPEDEKQTALFLRKRVEADGVKYSFAGGFGAFNFPFDAAADYVPSTDGYHYVVIIKEGAHYSFYLDGGLAYNTELVYDVAEGNFSDEPLYLFGRVENGNTHSRMSGEIADFRIYNGTMDPETVAEVLLEMKN